MRFNAGDHVIDHKGREVMLECRALMEHEIKATQRPEGFQFLLA